MSKEEIRGRSNEMQSRYVTNTILMFFGIVLVIVGLILFINNLYIIDTAPTVLQHPSLPSWLIALTPIIVGLLFIFVPPEYLKA